jgi:tetratricopeptide (TPR) repeat protein
LAKPRIIETAISDPAAMSAKTAADYASRGWLFYSNQKYEKAVDDFRHVLEEDRNEIDTWYGLGLSLKAAGASIDAVDAFGKVLELIGSLEDKQRANILGRLAKGQINQIKTGDWNLEKEVWKRS